MLFLALMNTNSYPVVYSLLVDTKSIVVVDIIHNIIKFLMTYQKKRSI